VSGEDVPRPGVYADLLELVAAHQAELAKLVGPLRAAQAPQISSSPRSI
jgi:hypothetical protein